MRVANKLKISLRRTRALWIIAAMLWPIEDAHAGVPVFEPPLPLEQNPNLDEREPNYEPVAATDGAGVWVVGWEGSYDIKFARSTDAGLTFTQGTILNSDWATDFVTFYGDHVYNRDSDLSLAGDATGRFIAVWKRELPAAATRYIELARSDDRGITWSAPAVLYTAARFPQIATDGNGTWIITFETRVPGGGIREDAVTFTRSTDGGLHWSAPATLAIDTDPGINDLSDSALAWSDGVWLATWTVRDFPESYERHVLLSRSIDGGITWSAPITVSSAATLAARPSASGDGAGNWVLGWDSAAAVPFAEITRSDIFVARSTDGAATWSAPVAVTVDADSMPYGVKLAAGTPGTHVAVWSRESRSEDGYGKDPDAFTAATTDGGLTWSLPVPLNDALTDNDLPFDHEFSPFIAHDPMGHWLALWSSDDQRLANGTKDTGPDIVMALGDAPCGNGSADPGEQCDTGRRGDLDCCNRLCQFDSSGTTCAADAELCTLERCDGAGTCEHQAAPAGTPCTLDSDVCTFDRCDEAATCEHVYEPHAGCKTTWKAGVAKLQISDEGDSDEHELRWKYQGTGTAWPEVVTGIGQRDYGVCVFDSGGLVTRADAPAGAYCPEDHSSACWNNSGGHSLSYQFRTREPSSTGMSRLRFKVTYEGKATINVVAKGPNLELPTLPLTDFPLTVQLVSSEGTCWEATYSESAGENSTTTFKGKSD